MHMMVLLLLMIVFFVLVVVDMRRVVSALWFWNDCTGAFDNPRSSCVWLGNGHGYLAHFCAWSTRQLYQLWLVDANASLIVVYEVLADRESVWRGGRYIFADFYRDAFRFRHFQTSCRPEIIDWKKSWFGILLFSFFVAPLPVRMLLVMLFFHQVGFVYKPLFLVAI